MASHIHYAIISFGVGAFRFCPGIIQVGKHLCPVVHKYQPETFEWRGSQHLLGLFRWKLLIRGKRRSHYIMQKGHRVASPSEENLPRWKGCVRSLILQKWEQVDETELSSSLMPLLFPLSGFLIWACDVLQGSNKGGDGQGLSGCSSKALPSGGGSSATSTSTRKLDNKLIC